MNCPLADAHNFVPATDDQFGEHEVCVDCDAVRVPGLDVVALLYALAGPEL